MCGPEKLRLRDPCHHGIAVYATRQEASQIRSEPLHLRAIERLIMSAEFKENRLCRANL